MTSFAQSMSTWKSTPVRIRFLSRHFMNSSDWKFSPDFGTPSTYAHIWNRERCPNTLLYLPSSHSILHTSHPYVFLDNLISIGSPSFALKVLLVFLHLFTLPILLHAHRKYVYYLLTFLITLTDYYMKNVFRLNHKIIRSSSQIWHSRCQSDNPHRIVLHSFPCT